MGCPSAPHSIDDPPARMLLLSEKLMSSCAAGTDGCLDLRRRASVLDGRVSAEWSRCPGSMARRPRDSVAPLRRSSAGWMPARIGRLSAGVASSHNSQGVDYEHCGTKQEHSTLRFNVPGLGWLFATLLLQNSTQSQQAASRVRCVMIVSCEMAQGVGDT